MLTDIGDIERVNLSAEADHVQRTVKSSGISKVISELVWNALDADATKILILLKSNELGGIESVVVKDNGTGISKDVALESFKKLGGSWKQNKRFTKSKRALHGKEGKGRLHFHSVSRFADWITTSDKDGEIESLKISIESDKIEECEIKKVAAISKSTGTEVTLSHLYGDLTVIDLEKITASLTQTFSPYIAIYSGISIFINGALLDPNATIKTRKSISPFDVIEDGKKITVSQLDLIIWSSGTDDRRIYCGSEPGVILDNKPAHVKAPGINFSAYAYSNYFEQAHKDGLLGLEELTEPVLSKTFEVIREKLSSSILEYEAEESLDLIEEYKSKGIYPYEQDPTNITEKAEQEVFAVSAKTASRYSRTFRNANDAEKAIMLKLLKQAYVANPGAISKVLSAVFELPQVHLDKFANVLESAELSGIIETSRFLVDRAAVLETLKRIVFAPNLRSVVKERGELDKFIGQNTWIFGERFHFTVEEQGLTKVIQRVKDEVYNKSKTRPVKTSSGKTARVDLFLGRIVPTTDISNKEFLIVELKRPNLTLRKKELDQIEEYAFTLSNEAQFAAGEIQWKFYLIGTDYDDYVHRKINQKDMDKGVAYKDENISIHVRSWAEIIDSCLERTEFISKIMNISIPDAEIENRIERITAGIK